MKNAPEASFLPFTVTIPPADRDPELSGKLEASSTANRSRPSR